MSVDDDLRGSNFGVLVGQSDWLFLQGADDVDIVGLYCEAESGDTGRSGLAEATVRRWQEILTARSQWFKQRGIVYLTVVIPDAHAVYPEHLPPGLRLRQATPFESVVQGLPADVAQDCLYLRPALLAAKEHGQVYRSTDSHWTDLGAFVGYQTTMAALAARGVELTVLSRERLSWQEREDFGELGATMQPERRERRQVASIREDRCAPVAAISNDVRDGYLEVVQQDAVGLPDAVIFRDSFMTHAHKFFSQSFHRVSYASHPNSLLYDLVLQRRPQVVLSVLSERRLARVVQEPNPMDFRALFGDISRTNRLAARSQVRARSLLRRDDAAGALTASNETFNALSREESAEILPRLLLHRARCYRAAGDQSAWLETARAATLADPGDAAVWSEFAQASTSLGQQHEAIGAWITSAQVEPEQPGYWANALNSLIRLGAAQQAQDLAEQATTRHPGDPDLWVLRSHALLMTGLLDGAFEACSQAVTLSPQGLHQRRQLATILVRQQAWGPAEQVLAALVRDDPDQPETRAWLERVVLAQQETAKGERDE